MTERNEGERERLFLKFQKWVVRAIRGNLEMDASSAPMISRRDVSPGIDENSLLEAVQNYLARRHYSRTRRGLF